jgi:hypothetical protein
VHGIIARTQFAQTHYWQWTGLLHTQYAHSLQGSQQRLLMQKELSLLDAPSKPCMQNGPPPGLILCCQFLEILNTWILELVFYTWSLRGQWSMCVNKEDANDMQSINCLQFLGALLAHSIHDAPELQEASTCGSPPKHTCNISMLLWNWESRASDSPQKAMLSTWNQNVLRSLKEGNGILWNKMIKELCHILSFSCYFPVLANLLHWI